MNDLAPNVPRSDPVVGSIRGSHEELYTILYLAFVARCLPPTADEALSVGRLRLRPVEGEVGADVRRDIRHQRLELRLIVDIIRRQHQACRRF